MEQQKENVFITLHTEIEDDGVVEENTKQHVGSFLNKDAVDVLIYEEDIDNAGVVRSFLTIHPDKVNIKRQGIIKMNQRFELNQATETHYEHPHGKLHMETYTESITYQSLREANRGKLKIRYHVSLNGQEKRNHLLTLTYKEEEI